MAKPDSVLQDDVVRELAWDGRLGQTQIGVHVSGGVVVLSGTVGSWALRNAFAEAAHRVAEVHDVANDLEVHPTASETPSDVEIAHVVRHALQWDALVPDQHIDSTVSGAVVTLEGTVESDAQREDAERAIAHLKGIRSVHNRIRIHPSLVGDDIESAIRQALNRRATREASHLHLSIKEGRVSVEGVVASADERRAVLGAVRGTRGVAAVDDRLIVEPKY
ncbi:MAG: OsmY protein [Myxococcales bacterium]|nr:OsmY protein [Myxococcales bacterium]